MNLNVTMVAQAITFFVFIFFCKKFVWPPLMNALDVRAKKIADGLAAAERGKLEMAAAEKRVQAELASAHDAGQKRIGDAEKRAQAIIEEAKRTASEEAARILASARADAEQQVSQARDALRAQVATLAVQGAEQILKREINPAAHADLLNQLKTEL